jgi:hypothetical protein
MGAQQPLLLCVRHARPHALALTLLLLVAPLLLLQQALLPGLRNGLLLAVPCWQRPLLLPLLLTVLSPRW